MHTVNHSLSDCQLWIILDDLWVTHTPKCLTQEAGFLLMKAKKTTCQYISKILPRCSTDHCRSGDDTCLQRSVSYTYPSMIAIEQSGLVAATLLTVTISERVCHHHQ